MCVSKLSVEEKTCTGGLKWISVGCSSPIRGDYCQFGDKWHTMCGSISLSLLNIESFVPGHLNGTHRGEVLSRLDCVFS